MALGRFLTSSWQVLGRFMAEIGELLQDLGDFVRYVAIKLRSLASGFVDDPFDHLQAYEQNRCLNALKKE